MVVFCGKIVVYGLMHVPTIMIPNNVAFICFYFLYSVFLDSQLKMNPMAVISIVDPKEPLT